MTLPHQARGRRIGTWTLWGVAAAVPLAFLAVFFAYPVLSLVGRGFFPDGVTGGVDLGGFADVFSRSRTWRVIRQTLAQAFLGTAGALALGLPGAYVLYRCRFRGQRFVRGLVSVPFVLPSVVVGAAFRALLGEGGPLGFLGLDRTMAAIVLALMFFNYTVVVRTVGGLWARLDPRTEQAARALGASPARAFFTVTLPALGPAIASAASVVFLFCATAFGIVITLGGIRYGTIESEIYLQTVQFLDLRAAAVLSVVQVVVVALALAVAAASRKRQERALSLRTEAAAPLRLLNRDRGPASGTGRRRLPRLGPDLVPAVVTVGTVIGLIATPILTLVARSFQEPDGSWGLQNYRNLADPGATRALNVSVIEAAGNSLRTAVDATLIAVVIGTLVAVLLSRRPRGLLGRRSLGLLDAAFMLPLGVSAVTVGFGILISLNHPPLDLRSSPILVPIAQAVVATPLVVRTLLPVLRAIDPRLREVAATLGASPGRVLATVDGPFLVRGWGLAVGFAFAVSLGEFGATSFLSRPDHLTLPVVIYRLLGRPGAENYGMAMAAAVILAALTATAIGLAERLRTKEATGW